MRINQRCPSLPIPLLPGSPIRPHHPHTSPDPPSLVPPAALATSATKDVQNICRMQTNI
jgi:hypothetical protein